MAKYPQRIGWCWLAALASVAGRAGAQPDPNNQPKAKNPDTPQPQVFQRQLRLVQPGQMGQQQLRNELAQAGYTDTALQDALVAYADEQGKAREKLREKARKVNDALHGNAVTDNDMRTLLEEFRAAVDDEKSRREAAFKALDAKIGYSKKPKLEALLTMLGLIGDEASYLREPNGGMYPMAGWPMGNMMPPIQNWNGPNQNFGGWGGQAWEGPLVVPPQGWVLPPGLTPGQPAPGQVVPYGVVPFGGAMPADPREGLGGLWIVPNDQNQILHFNVTPPDLRLHTPPNGAVTGDDRVIIRDGFVVTPPPMPKGDVTTPPDVGAK